MKTKSCLTVLFICVLLCGALLVGCSVSSPTDTIKTFFTEISHGKVNDAYGLYCKALQNKTTEGPSGLAAMANRYTKVGGVKEYKDIKEDINGDTASVTMNIVVMIDGKMETHASRHALLKEDGKWKITEFEVDSEVLKQ